MEVLQIALNVRLKHSLVSFDSDVDERVIVFPVSQLILTELFSAPII